MNILLVASTTAEIDPFIRYYRTQAAAFYHEVDVLITGIGLMASTYSLARQIHARRPDLIIQAGIAGCFNPAISLGTVLVVKQDTVADMGVVEGNTMKTIFDLGLARSNQTPYHNGWLVNKHDILKKVKLKKVKGISVNQITTSKKMMAHYTQRFHPAVESMEGAALHYIALSENLAFLQLRSVSNYAGERNKKKWDLNYSITNLNKELIQLLEHL